MFKILLETELNSKLVRLKMKVKFRTEGLNSKLVRLNIFKEAIRSLYQIVVARVKTFFGTFDFWIALQSFGLQCKSA